LSGGAGAPTEEDPARSVASDLSAGKRFALRASFYFAGLKSRASTQEKTPRHVGALRKPATDGRRIAKELCRARYIVPLRPKGKIAGGTPALRKPATDGRRIAKELCRARYIVPLRPKGKIAGGTPALRKSATGGRRIAEELCRARLIPQGSTNRRPGGPSCCALTNGRQNRRRDAGATKTGS